MIYSATTMRIWLIRAFAATLILATFAGVALAESDGVDVVRVEEDWELVVGTPDPESDAPQILCTISPLGDADTLHATLEINHHTIPDFAAGGLQFEVWYGEQALNERKFPDQAFLSTPGEVVTWTQSMEINGCNLNFEITDGDSATWGKFGGQGYLKCTAKTHLDNLNQYNPAVSVEHSKVGYSGNRVQSLVLKRVRLFTSNGEVIEDATARVVHQKGEN